MESYPGGEANAAPIEKIGVDGFLTPSVVEEFNDTAAAGYDCPIGPEVVPSAQ